MSFLLVVVGTVLSFATGTSVGRMALDSVGVGVMLLGCVGVLAALAGSAFTVTQPSQAEGVITSE